MNKPYVIMNAGMTVDGKIASKTGDSRISCEEDLDRVHRLRKDVDGIMIGIGTLLTDNPRLTVRRTEGGNPTRIVVDSKARTPTSSKVLDDSAITIISVSKLAEEKDIRRLRSQGAEITVYGEEIVDLEELLNYLSTRGIKRLLLEGGATLNWSMLDLGLVDEVRVSIAPYILGGTGSKTLVEGEGAENISNSVKLQLKKIRKIGKDLLAIYEVGGPNID